VRKCGSFDDINPNVSDVSRDLWRISKVLDADKVRSKRTHSETVAS
jgi:hypothetical protein